MSQGSEKGYVVGYKAGPSVIARTFCVGRLLSLVVPITENRFSARKHPRRMMDQVNFIGIHCIMCEEICKIIMYQRRPAGMQL